MAGSELVAFARGHAMRALPPVLILGLCVWLLAPHLRADALNAILSLLAELPAQSWGLALTATACSFWAIGRYDAIAHRHLQTGIDTGAARIGGSAAIGLAQVVGFGVITGALVRSRIFKGLELRLAAALSGFVSVSFVAAWAVVAALACLLLPAPKWTVLPAAAALLAAFLGAGLMLRFPVLRLGRARIRLPTLRACAALVSLAFIDTGFAALALYVFLPSGAGIGFAPFLPLFLLALGAALISNTPGGLGPFEVMLLTLLPHLPKADVLASIVAFRLVYYALPALLAMVALLRPMAANPRVVSVRKPLALAHAPRAEVGVIAQNGGALLDSADGCLASWPTGQTLTALFDPLRGSPHTALAALCNAARAQDRIPLVYKCTGRLAAVARRAGWSVLHSADEAVIPLSSFNLAGPSHRSLRRKLRAAEKAHVNVTSCEPPPFADLARIDAAWQARCGVARGGTMGRYTQDYVSSQWVEVASLSGKPMAFVTFHRSTREWCLDLMRSDKSAPDGTMHMLVLAGIRAAHQAGAEQVSLAANVACPDPASPLWRWISRQMVARSQDAGLRQFKSSFAPRRTALYTAAPGPLSLAIGLADIAREVHHPPPLEAENMRHAHKDVDEYELASRRAA